MTKAPKSGSHFWHPWLSMNKPGTGPLADTVGRYDSGTKILKVVVTVTSG